MLCPVLATDTLTYCVTRISGCRLKSCEAFSRLITSKPTLIFPPCGVNFKALDIRLLNIFSTLSSSSHIRKVSSRPYVFRSMHLSLAFTRKMLTWRCRQAMRSARFTCRRRVSFSSLLKSIIWLTSLSIRFTLRCTMCSRFLSSPSIRGLLQSWVTGPEIMVSGVRNSCEILAKKLMFIRFTRCSCSFSCHARRASSFSALMRRRARRKSRATAVINMK